MFKGGYGRVGGISGSCPDAVEGDDDSEVLSGPL